MKKAVLYLYCFPESKRKYGASLSALEQMARECCHQNGFLVAGVFASDTRDWKRKDPLQMVAALKACDDLGPDAYFIPCTW